VCVCVCVCIQSISARGELQLRPLKTFACRPGISAYRQLVVLGLGIWTEEQSQSERPVDGHVWISGSEKLNSPVKGTCALTQAATCMGDASSKL
jgi:hypothetical protein